MALDLSPIERAKNEVSKKKVQRLASRILNMQAKAREKGKDLSLNAEKNIRSIYELAAWLYAFECYDHSFAVCSILDHYEFNGNYTLWSFIKCCRLLKCSIERMRGDEANAQAIIDSLTPFENPDLYETAWTFSKKRAVEIRDDYEAALSGQESMSYVKDSALGFAMICNDYLQFHYFPEDEENMKKWIAEILEFIRKEER